MNKNELIRVVCARQSFVLTLRYNSWEIGKRMVGIGRMVLCLQCPDWDKMHQMTNVAQFIFFNGGLSEDNEIDTWCL